MATSKVEKDRQAQLIKDARKRFTDTLAIEGDMRQQMIDDYKFINVKGEQWDSGARKDREAQGRPCLEVNRLKPSVLNITNEQRQNRPQIKVNPVDDNADVDTAKIMQGIIKHIEIDSAADTAYDTAGEHAATMGRGFFRVITEYTDADSFDQDIKIKRISNPLAVLIDPAAKEVDGSDATWGQIVVEMARDEFEAQYPDSDVTAKWDDYTDQSDGWVTTDSIRVCEYFYRTDKPDTLLKLKNGTVVFRSEFTGKESQIISKRPTVKHSWKWAKLTSAEVLEETDWLGAYLPIVPVVGEEYFVDDKRMFRGIVQAGKDSQQLYNFAVSNELEMIGLMPKAPFIMAEGQAEGHEEEWANANSTVQSVLFYKPTTVGSQLVGAPQRNMFEAPIQALSANRNQAAEDIKTTTGVYDASLGARSNETSGKAILARQQQGATTTFHFTDNLNRAIRHLGKILVDLIPKIYNEKRVINIVGDNGEHEQVLINALFEKNGKGIQYDINIGKYDVVITTGPSFATRRQEALQSMLDAAQAYPPLMQIAADIMFRNMDFPGAEEIARRVAKTIDPKLMDNPDNGDDPQVKIQQMGQVIEQMQGQLQALNAHAQQLEQALQQATAAANTEHEKLDLQAQKLQIDAEMNAGKLELQRKQAEYDAMCEQQKLALEREKIALERQKLVLEQRATISEEQALIEGVDEVTRVLAEQMQSEYTDKLALLKREIVETLLDAPITIDVEKTSDTNAIATITSELPNDESPAHEAAETREYEQQEDMTGAE